MNALTDIPTDYDDIAGLKIPPHSLEAEQSVLGGLMIDPGAWDRMDGMITAEDFYRPEHRVIFGAVAALAATGNPIDPITLADHLSHAGTLDQAGGIGYLAEMAAKIPGAANIRAYATAVRDRSRLRALITAGNEIADSGFNPDGRAVEDLVDDAQRRMLEIGAAAGGSELPSVNDDLRAAVDEIDRLYNSDGALTGLSTGIEALDRRLLGLQGGDLVILAARPSMGKTTLALNMVEHNVLLGIPCMVFSGEMPRGQLMLKMISSVGRINFERVRSGKLLDDEWPRLSAAISKLKDQPLFIDDRNGLTVAQIRASARKVHRKTPLKLIVVDYLQIVGVAKGGRDSRNEDVSAISCGLKSLARELGIPVIALSQLNRGCENRPNKRPRNSDLRDSGAIEQDADVIMFIYRDEVYNEDSPQKGVAEFITGKQRLGPIGTDYASSMLQFSRFDNLAHGYEPPPQPERSPKRGGFEY